jgi:hypothetical protein
MDYRENGIYVDPNALVVDETVKLTYDGLLAQFGAQEVYIHCGVSNRGTNWNQVKDFKMRKDPMGAFTANVTIPKGETFSVCFHDNAYNWDNNNGNNYSYGVIGE